MLNVGPTLNITLKSYERKKLQEIVHIGRERLLYCKLTKYSLRFQQWISLNLMVTLEIILRTEGTVE